MTASQVKVKAPVIEGKLGSSVLAGLLKRVEQSRTAAYLLVSDGLSEKCVFFSVGAIRLSSIGRRRGPALEGLLAQRLMPDILARAKARMQETGRSLEEVLAEPAFDRSDLVRECSAAIVRDEMLDLVAWEGPSYEFCEANPPPKIFDPRLEAVKLSFGTMKLLKEVEESIQKYGALASRLPGRARLSQGPTHVYGPPAGVDPVVGKVLLEVVGDGRTVEETILEARRRGVDCMTGAQALIGLIESRTLDTARRAALTPEEEKAHARQEVVELEGAIDLLINELVARQRLAQGYGVLGDDRRAALNLKKVGEELMVRNRVDEAVDTFRRVLKIVPHDFAVRERLIKLFERLKKLPEAIAEGLELANIYKRFGLVNRAKNLYRFLVGLSPQQLELRRWLIDLLIKSKDTKEAVAECEQLASIVQAQGGSPDDLIAIYQQILAIEPGHVAANQKLNSMVRRRLSFLVPFAGLVAGLLVVAGLALYFVYQFRALGAYADTKSQALSLAEADRIPDARSRLEAFVNQWEWSQVTDKARMLADRLTELEKERRERRFQERLNEAAALESQRDVTKAEALYKEVVSGGASTIFGDKARERLEKIKRDREEAARLAYTVRSLVQENREATLKEAFEVARSLLAQYPWTEDAQGLDVPLLVTSIPPGARITVGDREQMKRTPDVVLRRAFRDRQPVPYRLLLTKEGFEGSQHLIDLTGSHVTYPFEVHLRRRQLWAAKVQTDAPLADAPAVLADGLILLGGRDQRLHAIEQDGRVRWARSLGVFADAAGTPGFVGGRAVVGDMSGHVTAFDIFSGERAWRRKIGPAAAFILTPGERLPVVAVDTAAGDVHGLDPRDGGRTIFRVAGGGRASRPPAFDPGTGTLYLVKDDGEVVPVDVAAGKERGSRFSAGGRPAAAPTVVRTSTLALLLVTTEDGSLCASTLPQGTACWRFTAMEGRVIAPPGGFGEVVLAGTTRGLTAVGLDGGYLWSVDLPGGVLARPSVRGTTAYVPTGAGLVTLSAHEVFRTGGREPAEPAGRDDDRIRWIFKTEGEVVAEPVPLANGVLLAASDGGLYALED